MATSSVKNPALGYSDEIDLIDIFDYLWDRKWRFSALVLATTTFVFVLSFAFTPMYRSETLLVYVEDSGVAGSMPGLGGQLGGLASLAGFGLDQESHKEEAVSILRSRLFTDGFIRQHELMPEIFYRKWDDEKETWKTKNERKIPTRWDAYKKFDEKIRSIQVDTRTGLISLVIEWRNPDLAAEWSNALVAKVNETLRQKAVDEANRSIEYLNAELGKTSVVEIRQAIFRIVEEQVSKIMLAHVREEYAFKVLDPAVPADPDEHFFPNRIVFTVAGLTLGILLAFTLAFVSALRIRRYTVQ